ncbi:MAG: glyoxalase [Clostridium sp.]|nr:glyoxalase [Clostridium sp.]
MNHKQEGKNMFDDAVLRCFLEKQEQLFPENVVETLEEADDFLEECMAVVVDSVQEVWEYFDAEGIDMEGADEEEILEADEVFDIGDGRYLIVEG